MKYELQRIISGESQVKYGAIIQTIAHYLSRSQSSSGLVKEFKHLKKQEAEILEHFIKKIIFGFQTLTQKITFPKELNKKFI